MGLSQMVELPVNCIWMATANNPDLSVEMARRVASIRIEPEEERPWELKNFRHPKLLRWARAHRGDLIRAALTLVKAWIAEGKPPGDETLGSYEEWAEIMGGILLVADIPGFLDNRDQVYAEADQEVGIWGEFLEVWYEESGNQLMTAADLFGVVRRHGLLRDVWAGHDEHGARTRFGIALAKMRGRVLGRFKLQSGPKDGHAKAPTYRLRLLPGNDLDSVAAGDAGGLPTSLEPGTREMPSDAASGEPHARGQSFYEKQPVTEPPAITRNPRPATGRKGDQEEETDLLL